MIQIYVITETSWWEIPKIIDIIKKVKLWVPHRFRQHLLCSSLRVFWVFKLEGDAVQQHNLKCDVYIV